MGGYEKIVRTALLKLWKDGRLSRHVVFVYLVRVGYS